MAQKVAILGLPKNKGYFYINDDGSLICSRQVKGRGRIRAVVIPRLVKKRKGYFYFIDAKGDLSRGLNRKPYG